MSVLSSSDKFLMALPVRCGWPLPGPLPWNHYQPTHSCTFRPRSQGDWLQRQKAWLVVFTLKLNSVLTWNPKIQHIYVSLPCLNRALSHAWIYRRLKTYFTPFHPSTIIRSIMTMKIMMVKVSSWKGESLIERAIEVHPSIRIDSSVFPSASGVPRGLGSRRVTTTRRSPQVGSQLLAQLFQSREM